MVFNSPHYVHYFNLQHQITYRIPIISLNNFLFKWFRSASLIKSDENEENDNYNHTDFYQNKYLKVNALTIIFFNSVSVKTGLKRWERKENYENGDLQTYAEIVPFSPFVSGVKWLLKRQVKINKQNRISRKHDHLRHQIDVILPFLHHSQENYPFVKCVYCVIVVKQSIQIVRIG